MKITIDCRHFNLKGGIEVYLKELLPFFLASGASFILLGDGKYLQQYAKNGNIEIVHCNIKLFSLRDTFAFPKSILKKINSGDIFYTPYISIPNGIKIQVYSTIHDIIFPDMPELTSKIGLAVRMWFYLRAYKKSKIIFTVSEFSKSRIQRHLGTEKPIIVTYSAIQPMFLAYRDNVKNIQKKQTIAFIGNIKKHKGLAILLDAFILARNEGLPHSLVIIGSKENFRTSDSAVLQKIESLGGEAVTFTGFVSDEQVMEHLSKSELLVQPSLYEGFCLPPLEAMVLGTHALISDIPVLKEIYSSYPVTFFKSGDSLDLKEKLIKLLLNKKPSSPVLSDALLNKYTFKKTADIIMQNKAFSNHLE